MSPQQWIFVGTAMFTAPGCTKAETVADASSAMTVAVGERPRAIATADFNADGLMDIAAANADSNTVSLLLQNAEGGFSRSDFQAGNEPADIAQADFNRDGRLDLVIANHETSAVTILLNMGDGTFEPMAGSPFDTTARPHLHSVAVADFNSDGFFDIASDSSDTDSIAVLFGRDGEFQPATRVDVGEFPYYRLGTMPTSGNTRVLVPSPRAHRVSSVDPSTPDDLTLVGEATGAVMARTGNFYGNGSSDVTATMSEGVVMWTQGENGFELVEGTPIAFDNATELAVGDIDGDGLDEVIASIWESDEIYIISNTGTLRQTISACFRPAALAAADLDGDGRAEIIAGCWNEPQIMIFNGAAIAGGR